MKCSPARIRRAVSFWPRKPPPGPARAIAAAAERSPDTSTGPSRRRIIAAISLSITICGSDMVLCESMRPHPETRSGLGPADGEALIAFS